MAKEDMDKVDSEEVRASMAGKEDKVSEVKEDRALTEVRVDKVVKVDKVSEVREVRAMVEDLLAREAMEEELKVVMGAIRVKADSVEEEAAATHTQVMASLKTTKTHTRAVAASRI